jgi:hypothetical protein
MLQGRERSDVPLATDAPQQTASSFDHRVGARKWGEHVLYRAAQHSPSAVHANFIHVNVLISQ